MKIVIVGTAYPYRGGLAAFNERLAREFQKEGHDVVMYTFTLQYPSFLFPGKTQYSDEPPPKDLSIKKAINSINPFNWLTAGRKIRKEKPDIVIFAYWMSFMAPCFGTIACTIKKDKKIKCIGLIHNMIPHEPNLLDKLFPPYFVNSMDAFVALSNSVVNDISKYDKKNKPKSFSPHPVYDHYGEIINKDSALSKLNLNKEKKYLLFFGFIRTYKGLDLLLDAFADKRLRKYNLKLIIAGEFYENEQFYMEKIKTLEIEPDIELRTNFIPDAEVNTYFCAADIIVQPYKSATQSGVTQIAYHFEKPMLVTNVGGLAEIVPHEKVGYVVHPGAESIADALVDFYENDRERFFTENTKVEKKKYEWAYMTETIIGHAVI
jgi:glycosyltransferase involved in cell wall biosynthesis